ncbi:hypothetical protein HCN44_004460 [Aphidius gifuensis]|uniref:Uncharacterized protein n=1 Tax=Aphidius gifuensis TaxID=684658 RepID=A0A834XZ78_APHGI|nr:hypothetical protein HCN44_004460 [Aphidius gifuensis]
MNNQNYQVTKKTKIAFTDAFNMCSNRLKVKGYLTNHKTNTNISWRSKIISQKMYDIMELMMNEISKCPDDEPMSIDEKIIKMFGIDCLNKTKKNIDIDSKNIIKNIFAKPTKQADDCISIDSWSNEESIDEEFEKIDNTKSNECVKIKKEKENYHKYDSMINNPLFSPIVVISNTKKIQQQIDLLVKEKKPLISVKNDTSFKSKRGNAYKTPYEMRVKAVNIKLNNPTMTLDELKKQVGCNELHSFHQLDYWKKDIKKKDIKIDDDDNIKNLRFIDTKRIISKLVHNKCLEYLKRYKKKNICSHKIKSFGIEVKKKYSSLKFIENFNPTIIWSRRFKTYYFPSSKTKNKDEIKTKNHLNVLTKDKVNIVNLAQQHSDWSIVMLREKSGCNYLSKKYLKSWQRQIDKINVSNNIDRWVYDKCVEYQKNNKSLSEKLLIEWADEAKKIFPSSKSYSFRVGDWIDNFKQFNNTTEIDKVQMDEQ